MRGLLSKCASWGRSVWNGAVSMASDAKNYVVGLASSLGVALGFKAPEAAAAVPLGVETVFTTAATDFGTVVGYGWTLFLTIIGGLILFKLVKKVFFKST